MKAKHIAWTAIVAFTLLALFALSLGTPVTQAAPMAAPTPVSVTTKNSNPEFPTFFAAKVLTADTRSSCFEVPDYTTVDLQTVIDQTDVNTVTLTLNFSNDNTNYSDGAAAVSANAADATALNQFALFGRWTCIYADVTNTNPVTITAIGVVK